ncbi:MAG: helix-turn-helix domain-containing protein [Pleurocapsa minor HA4230-MV1]|nr:helix-turn-helix domain-containing protein [Pleurocapsa minor HA4230-MV1]
MVRIKQLRQAKNITQANLAERLNTTQQTIQRWETGKTNIPSESLKELAIVLDCSVDELLGIAKYSRTRYGNWFLSESEKKSRQKLIGYYGGVHLKLRGISQLKDYPIDDLAAKNIHSYFPAPDEGFLSFNWIFFETMDNKIVFVNTKALKTVQVYTDHYEGSPPFSHPEIYRFLTDCDVEQLEDGVTASEIAINYNLSKDFAEKVIGVIMNHEKTKQESWNWISFSEANVYWLDGEQDSYLLDKRLWWTLADLRTLCNDPIFFSDNNEIPSGALFLEQYEQDGYSEFLNLDNIALIEVPAIKYWQLACEDSPDLLEHRELSPYLPLSK